MSSVVSQIPAHTRTEDDLPAPPPKKICCTKSDYGIALPGCEAEDERTYIGEREGYSWTCLVGCIDDQCRVNHPGFFKGLYVIKYCDRCCSRSHWINECPMESDGEGGKEPESTQVP